MSPTISIQNLVVSRKGDVVLDGLSVVFKPGLTALCGGNGSGKTTLFESITGLMLPTAGSVEFVGGPVVLGYSPHADGLQPRLTLDDAMRYLAWLRRVPSPDVRCDQVCAEFSLQGLRRRRLSALSAGERQRFAIAAATLQEPNVLLLDEPTANLDPSSRREILGAVRRASAQATVVMSTHQSIDLAQLGCDVVTLESGRVAFAGTLTDLTGQSTPSVECIDEAIRGLEGMGA